MNFMNMCICDCLGGKGVTTPKDEITNCANEGELKPLLENKKQGVYEKPLWNPKTRICQKHFCII